MKEKNLRDKYLHLRLTRQEYDALHANFKKTTCRKLSEYARKVLLSKPVAMTLRNQSTDDFMAEMMRLRLELKGIGNNYNQAVKKLHILGTLPDFKNWLITYDLEKKTFQNKVEEIKTAIRKIAELWLR